MAEDLEKVLVLRKGFISILHICRDLILLNLSLLPYHIMPDPIFFWLLLLDIPALPLLWILQDEKAAIAYVWAALMSMFLLVYTSMYLGSVQLATLLLFLLSFTILEILFIIRHGILTLVAITQEWSNE